MKKRKHKKQKNSFNIKKSIFVVILFILIIYITLNAIFTSKITSQEKSSSIVATTPSNNQTLEKETYLEDTDVKHLLDNIIHDNNLNESNFAMFYFNKTTNKYYFYNKYTFFSGASTVKVPIAMYYYDLINNTTLNKNDKLLYSRSCYEPGSGTTDYTYSIGQYVPINFLLEQSIVNSDNTAINILIKNIGYSTYRQCISKYTDEALPSEFFSTNIISASYGFDIMNYLYEHIDSYEYLINNMKKSSSNLYLKKYIKDYDVAHKYGSYNGYLHDYGIVFGKDTYLIGIFTKNIHNADELIANINLDILNYTLK